MTQEKNNFDDSLKSALKNASDKLENIAHGIEDLKPKKSKIDWALITSVVAIMVSVVAIYDTNSSNKKTFEEQQKIQAYSYWQNFLALTVEYPELANG